MQNLEGKRDEWQFDYSVSDLLRGATSQREFRASRLAFWKTAKDKTMADAEKSGLIIDESVADESSREGNYTMSYANTRTAGPSISVNPKFQKRLNECQSKISYHQQMYEIYDGWVQILESQKPDTSKQLVQADWLFFFGKVNPYI